MVVTGVTDGRLPLIPAADVKAEDDTNTVVREIMSERQATQLPPSSPRAAAPETTA